MRQSHAYYVAASLFALAALINFSRDPSLRLIPLIGLILVAVMLWLAVQTQRAGN